MADLIFTKAEKIKAIAWLDSYIDSLDDEKKYKIEIKEHRKKRSLTSNSYAWQLMDKLAVVLCKSKEEIYKSYIKEIGGNNEMLNVKTAAVERLTREWQRNGLGYVIDVIESYDNGFSDVILYYGSHTYNQAQMNRMISLIVQDCKEYGIETESPDELQRLVDMWGGDANA